MAHTWKPLVAASVLVVLAGFWPLGGRISGSDSGGSSGVEVEQARRLEVGDQAILFTTIDEHERPVDMADLIDGRPLVLVTGSVT
jgi:hypothetical protein